MLSFVMRRMFLCIFFENLFNIGSVAGCVDKQQNTTDNLLEELRYLKEKEFILYLTMLTIPSLQSMLEYYIECSLHKMLFQYFRGAVAKKNIFLLNFPCKASHLIVRDPRLSLKAAWETLLQSNLLAFDNNILVVNMFAEVEFIFLGLQNSVSFHC